MNISDTHKFKGKLYLIAYYNTILVQYLSKVTKCSDGYKYPIKPHPHKLLLNKRFNITDIQHIQYTKYNYHCLYTQFCALYKQQQKILYFLRLYHVCTFDFTIFTDDMMLLSHIFWLILNTKDISSKEILLNIAFHMEKHLKTNIHLH